MWCTVMMEEPAVGPTFKSVSKQSFTYRHLYFNTLSLAECLTLNNNLLHFLPNIIRATHFWTTTSLSIIHTLSNISAIQKHFISSQLLRHVLQRAKHKFHLHSVLISYRNNSLLWSLMTYSFLKGDKNTPLYLTQLMLMLKWWPVQAKHAHTWLWNDQVKSNMTGCVVNHYAHFTASPSSKHNQVITNQHLCQENSYMTRGNFRIMLQEDAWQLKKEADGTNPWGIFP